MEISYGVQDPLNEKYENHTSNTARDVLSRYIYKMTAGHEEPSSIKVEQFSNWFRG